MRIVRAAGIMLSILSQSCQALPLTHTVHLYKTYLGIAESARSTLYLNFSQYSRYNMILKVQRSLSGLKLSMRIHLSPRIRPTYRISIAIDIII